MTASAPLSDAALDGQSADDPPYLGVRVTAEDIATGSDGVSVIFDDYVIIAAGKCEVVGIEAHANGTHVITVRGVDRRRPVRMGDDAVLDGPLHNAPRTADIPGLLQHATERSVGDVRAHEAMRAHGVGPLRVPRLTQRLGEMLEDDAYSDAVHVIRAWTNGATVNLDRLREALSLALERQAP